MNRFWVLVAIVGFVLTAGCIEDDERETDDSGEEGELVLHILGVPLDEGETGTMSVPLIGVNFVDTDVKHHWNMPVNITGVMVNVSWTGDPWDVELSIGIGDCPHEGTAVNSTSGSDNQLSIQYWAGGEDTLDETQWFCHLGLEDPSSHRGETIDYLFEVYLFSYDEDCGDACAV